MKRKQMKLFGMQMLGNKGAFELLWWMGPLKATHLLTRMLFDHCEENANAMRQRSL